MIRCYLGLIALLAGPGSAQTLDFPSNASLQITQGNPLDSYQMPIGIWENGTMPTATIEGELTVQAWRINAQSLTTLQLLRPLREQLRNDRFRVIFECQTEACGGFDFRFGVRTLPPPEMKINLGDFRFLAARRVVQGGTEYVSLFVSRTAQAGYVQVTVVRPPTAPDVDIARASSAPLRGNTTAPDSNFETKLDLNGHVVLDDLSFATGSSQLGEGPFASLQSLADYLTANPNRTVALVGHTDASGSLAGNIALSKRRAASVLERLVGQYGISRRQLEAEGMGYLAPIANNLTEDGRETNRRVEVIITSTEE
ncbi:OmpA family protein [Yoonia sp. SS1-5]|uniref:OmpA family protein n=1 Tax=Yoonia rhodophyticola TaxID=3137370 RepID=A0AAN0MBK6_9RHOB